jgi:hypothetical protein
MLRLSFFLGRFLLGWASGVRTKIFQCSVLGFRGRVLTLSQTWFFETAHLFWPLVMLSFAFTTKRFFPLASFSAASLSPLAVDLPAPIRCSRWVSMWVASSMGPNPPTFRSYSRPGSSSSSTSKPPRHLSHNPALPARPRRCGGSNDATRVHHAHRRGRGGMAARSRRLAVRSSAYCRRCHRPRREKDYDCPAVAARPTRPA